MVLWHRGQVVLIRGFGVADYDTRTPVTPKTLFRIGSTTKVLTAIEAMRMVEAGQLDLDKPITAYLSEFKLGGTITLRQLLSHTAGLADKVALYGPLDANALRDYVASLTREFVLALPGQVFSYSNLGYNVAGRVEEQVAGKPYVAQVSDAVSALGMTRTTWTLSSAVATGYKGGQPVRPTPDNGSQYPAGFALSSAEDLAHVLEFLLRDGKVGTRQVLSTEHVREMKTPVLGVNPFDQFYGLGLWLTQRRGLAAVGHGGNLEGYTCFLETIPSQQLGLAVVCNADGFVADPIMGAALDVLKVPQRPVPSPPATFEANDYAGLYEWMSPLDGTIDIWRVYSAADGLHLATLESDAALTPARVDGFRLGDRQVAFLRDPSTRQVTFLSTRQASPRLPAVARDVNVPLELADTFTAERGVLQSPSRAQNDATAARAARTPERLLAFGTADLREAGAHDELRRCLTALNMVGLRLSLAGLDLRNPEHLKRLQTALEIAQERSVPVFLELQDAQGRTLDAPTMKLFVEQVAVPYPNVRMAFAHAGGTGLDPAADLTATRNLAEAYRDHPEVWSHAFLELSETGSPQLAEVLRLWGFPRVLMGGGDPQKVLRTPMRRAERAALAVNSGAAWLGR